MMLRWAGPRRRGAGGDPADNLDDGTGAMAGRGDAIGDQGRLDLAEASGTFWNGQATMVVASGSDPGASRASLPRRSHGACRPGNC